MAQQNLLWLDMEMTGLDVEKEAIIEVAAIVTDFNFEHKETYHSVVWQPQSLLAKMDDWNSKHHRDSGLLEKIPNGKKLTQVESELCALIKKHWPGFANGNSVLKDDKVLLAGNSFGQDRAFIEKSMPALSAMLHYRMLDVSSWKIIFINKLNRKYEKKNAHRALDDIQESIAELKFYLGHIKL